MVEKSATKIYDKNYLHFEGELHLGVNVTDKYLSEVFNKRLLSDIFLSQGVLSILRIWLLLFG